MECVNGFRARINSIERVAEYQNLEQEAPHFIQENKPPANWPQVGLTVCKPVPGSC
jgi:hypothetical protein